MDKSFKVRASVILPKDGRVVWDDIRTEEFLAHFESGGSIEEAAERYGLTVGSVRAYLLRLRRDGQIPKVLK